MLRYYRSLTFKYIKNSNLYGCTIIDKRRNAGRDEKNKRPVEFDSILDLGRSDDIITETVAFVLKKKLE